MAIYTINSDADLPSLTTASGDTVLFKTNTIFNPTLLKDAFLSVDNLTIGYTGTGSKPIFSGATTRSGSSFTQDVIGGVWYINSATNIYGNITEDGVKMQYVEWTTDLATTKALMVDGQFTVDGGAVIGGSNYRIYIKTAGNNPVGKTYVLSEANYGIRTSISPVSTTGLRISDLSFNQLSRFGLLLAGTKNAVVNNVDFDYIGGTRSGGVSFGNGVQLYDGVVNLAITNSTATNIFDTGFSTQVFTPSATSYASDTTYENLIISKCGMSAIEISTPASATGLSVKNTRINNINISDLPLVGRGLAGSWDYTWAGSRGSVGGIAISVYCTLDNKDNTVTNTNVSNVTVNNAARLINDFNTHGINKYWNIYGNNISKELASQTGRATEKALYYNVTDNQGRTPSGIGIFSSCPALANPRCNSF